MPVRYRHRPTQEDVGKEPTESSGRKDYAKTRPFAPRVSGNGSADVRVCPSFTGIPRVYSGLALVPASPMTLGNRHFHRP